VLKKATALQYETSDEDDDDDDADVDGKNTVEFVTFVYVAIFIVSYLMVIGC